MRFSKKEVRRHECMYVCVYVHVRGATMKDREGDGRRDASGAAVETRLHFDADEPRLPSLVARTPKENIHRLQALHVTCASAF